MIDTLTDEFYLLKRARALDNEALGEIHDRYYPEIYRYAYHRTGNGLHAEDIASEVFLRLLDSLHGGHPPQSTLRGWLFGVASNLVADHFRGGDHQPLDEWTPDGKTSQMVEQQLLYLELKDAIRGLTPEQQEVISLRFGEGYSVEETAQIMKRPITSIKAVQFRAIDSLRRKLAEDDKNE